MPSSGDGIADTGERMTDPVLLSLDKVFLELRYPPSLLYQDFMGTIAHTARSVFPEVELGLAEIVVHEGTPEDPRMRISPSLAWFSPTEGTAFVDFMMWVRPVAERILGEIIEVEEIHRVGVRSYSLLAMNTVDEGVSAFRRSVADHYGPPFSVLTGQPSGVRMEFRTTDWETIEGHSFDLTAFLAPITLPDSVRERLSREEQGYWEGGLLLDLDAALGEGQVVSVNSALELAGSMAQRLSATVDSLVNALPKEKDELRERAEGH